MADTDQHSISRRRLLGWGGSLPLSMLSVSVLPAAILSGCGADGGLPELDPPEIGPPEQARCVRRAELTRFARLDGLPLVYEVSQRRASFWMEPGFAGQLATWFAELSDRLPARPDQVWSYGTWTDGGGSCSSWHNAGRAFDLSRIRLARGGFVSCRYDQWRTAGAAVRERALRQYWAVAASLHLHFAHVLTYLYDRQHHNHIHVDNGRSGSGRSSFRTRSGVQVQAVQAMCTHLWGRPLEVTGRWDPATRQATRSVLDGLGVAGDLDSAAGWSSFLAASSAMVTED